jgi:hypothetical protein
MRNLVNLLWISYATVDCKVLDPEHVSRQSEFLTICMPRLDLICSWGKFQ